MAKGSVRKKGKKWYYRFYVEDESGNRIQKELPGTENKNETESLLRKAMEEYENQKLISKAANLTLNEMLDMWIAEELKPSGRIGEVCALTWQGIDLKEQYLTVRRSVSYNNTRHKTEIGPTKRKKIRTVDFCDTLADILKKAKTEQQHDRKQYGELYRKNYYIEVIEKSRSYFELYSLGQPDVVPEGYKELSHVCTKPDGSYESVRAVTSITKSTAKKVAGIEDFHFHLFRHTYTSNLLSRGATPKDVQELLGHSDVSTTMNIYAHATRDSKKASARLLDQSTVSA